MPLYLFAFRLDPDTPEPQLYTVFLYDDVDRPLMREEGILFFTDPALAPRALEAAGMADVEAPREVALTCDVAELLYVIAHGDRNANAVNSLNALLDLVAATQLAMPREHRRALHALADHLTFDHAAAKLFAQGDVTRLAAQDAVLWALGAVTARARVIG